MSSNLKLALDQYDAQQRRQQALVEAQRIGNLIHIQEQQLVAARHLAKQRKAARRQQHLLQHQQLQQQQQQQSSIVAQPALDTLAESVFEEEEENSTSSASRTKTVTSRRAARKAKLASQACKLAPQHAHSEEEAARAELGSPVSITRRYASHRRRPQEPNAVLAPRSTWKPDSHTSNCDNILCRKQFTLLGEKRHHCRRCGNIFCSACLTHKQVLYDMRQSSWRIFPERLLASIFPSDPKQESTVHCSTGSMNKQLSSPPSSPAMTALSSSFESGSSHGSGDYFDSKPSSASSSSSSRRSVSQPPRPKAKKPLLERRRVTWEKGTDEHVPTPVPENWRAHVLDSASEEPVCDDCHCILWGVDTPTDLFYQNKALMMEREEIAWAIWLQGLDKWDACLRKHGLTLKRPLEEREKEKQEKRLALKERRESSTSRMSLTSGEDSGKDLDYAGRPMHTSTYAWPTAPNCIRFTTAALKPRHTPQIRDKETPSIFGMHRSVPRYIPTPTLPTPVFTPEQVAYYEEKEIERIEEDRQKRYREAIEDFLGDAYAMSDLSDDFRRRIHFDKTSQPSVWESLQGELAKCALDVASRWRGDNYGGW